MFDKEVFGAWNTSTCPDIYVDNNINLTEELDESLLVVTNKV